MPILCYRESSVPMTEFCGTGVSTLCYSLTPFFVTEKPKSVRGYTCMQIFVFNKFFVEVYGMKPVKDFPQAQLLFVQGGWRPEDFSCRPTLSTNIKGGALLLTQDWDDPAITGEIES